MTPRQADVAFVLEGVEGVRGVHAIEAGSTAAAAWDFAVQLDGNTQQQAHAHYMLLRALTHQDIQRVYWSTSGALPPNLAGVLRALRLTELERDAARTRARPVEPFACEPASTPHRAPRPLRRMLVIASSPNVVGLARRIYAPVAECVFETEPEIAQSLANSGTFDVIICEGPRLNQGFAVEACGRMILVGNRHEARTNRYGLTRTRFLTKPFSADSLKRAVAEVLGQWIPDPFRGSTASSPASRSRALRTASSKVALRLLLVDVEAGIRSAIAKAFSADAAEIDIAYGADAVERALSTPFHLIFCSTTAALASDGFFAAVRREDPIGLRRVVVLVPSADVDFVQSQLPQNRTLRLPIDDAILRGLVARAAPKTIERAAVHEIQAPPARVEPPRHRRLAVLVVDEHLDTQILFAAGTVSDRADIALAPTTLLAFEHLTSRAVDMLVISATMRSDGGEPFYRVIWRMVPALKAVTILVTDLAGAPASPRILQRPLSRAALDEVVSRASR